MKNESVFYFYPRDKKGERLGHSIAVVIEEGRPFVGFSQLGTGDIFNRKVGRQIAEARARQQLERFRTAKARWDDLPKSQTELREGVRLYDKDGNEIHRNSSGGFEF